MRLGAGLAAAVLLAVLAAGVAELAAAGGHSAVIAADRQVIGRSVERRAITAVQLGDPSGARVGLIVGLIHGDEHAGLAIARQVRRFAASKPDALTGTQLWVIDSVNPDGQRAHTRKNAHGVDLNRNFPYRWHDQIPPSSGYYPGPRPASEPETRAAVAFIERIQPDVSIWYHQPWRAVLACHGRPQVAAHYAKLVHMRTSCRGAGLRGTAISWETHSFPGSAAFVVELPPGGISTHTARLQARAALAVAEGR